MSVNDAAGSLYGGSMNVITRKNTGGWVLGIIPEAVYYLKGKWREQIQ